MVMPGMISRIKYPNEVACVDPDECYKYCQSYAGCTNIAYPRLVLGLMPTGLKGLMMAVMIAALMSDLDSIFNSASTLFTIDIWKKIRKKAGTKEQMIVGRVFILVMMGVAIAWVPVVKETQGGQVFIYIQEITNYFAPPIAAVFVIGVIWPRANEQGAFWGLMAGFVTGLARLILIFIFRPPGQCGEEDTRPAILKDFHYMYFAMLLYWITTIVCVVISVLTAPLPPEKTWKTTFWSRHDPRTLQQVRAGVTLDQLKESQGDDANDTRGIDNPTLSVDDVELKENGKKVWTTPSEDVEEQPTQGGDGDKQKWCPMSLKDWLCGFDSIGEESQTKEKQRILIITSLKQDKMAKYCLNFGLIVILALGTGMYIFWSTWKYIPDESNGYNTTSASI
ncbi:unnamed protein product [Owenia fusiformis]|uniref:Sodium/myo-inositol cotransporter n=1 Tax=Owenia fusiformis TaxID=6347 RepID=A0A8S4PSF9_OWEFU|nr:unnamed protein product [Owenia fusiformis]